MFKNGDKIIVLPCKAHDNCPGWYIWDSSRMDHRERESVIRVECGCVFVDGDKPQAVATSEAVVTKGLMETKE